ncbi:MAG: hypothetical protein ABIP55_02510 [Tepidisphaeraceae bacterium]
MRTLLRDLGTVSGVQCACIVRSGEVLASSFQEADAVAQAASLGFVRGITDGLELVDRGFEELLIDFGARSLMVAPVDKDFVLAMLAAPDANTQLLRVVMGSSVRQLRRMHDIGEKAEPAPAPAAAARPAAPQAAGVAAPSGAPPPPKPAAQQAAPPPPPKPQAAAQPPPPKPQGAPPPPPPQHAKPAPTGRPQPPQQQGRPAPPPPPSGRPAPPPPPIKGQQPQQPPRPQQQPAPPPPAAAARPAAKPEPVAAKPADKDAEPILPQILALLTEYIGPVARVSFKRGVTRWRETSTPTVGTLGELAKILAADLSSDSEKKAFLDAVEKLRG